MSIEYRNRIKVGSRIRITEDVEMPALTYKAGHEFVVTGWGERGLDLEDDDGNKLCETRFIHKFFELVTP